MAKLKSDQSFADPDRGKVMTPRFVIAVALMVLGVAWVLYYYFGVRPDPAVLDAKAGKPKFMADLKDWNYLIGFGSLFLGLMISAHPSTPLGRNRGVVVGMLGCFIFGLIWICVFYVLSGDPALHNWPVFTDLGQKNLIVGIAAMAVGFTFATRWE